jgi:hypothetical protein
MPDLAPGDNWIQSPAPHGEGTQAPEHAELCAVVANRAN